MRALSLIAVAAATASAQPPAEVPPVEPAVESAVEPAPEPAAEPPPEPAPEPAPETPVDPALDDIDLGMLGLDPDSPTYDDKLQIYGFADFSYAAIKFSSSLVDAQPGFGVGNLNLYIRKNLSARWRTLTEVRLLFAPNGSPDPATGEITSTAVADRANLDRPVSWGGISIERAYVEYDVAPWLTIRAGRFLTPYGIWNIDHGSPTIIGTHRPYIIGEQFFPEHQTGLEAFGKKALGEYTLQYHATVSNGRSKFEATQDPDGKVAFGGRLVITAPWAGSVVAGVSAYAGRASESTRIDNSGVNYDEVALGADIAWDHGGLRVQAEVLSQQRRYRDGQRGARLVGFTPDGAAWGAYGLVGYRTTKLWNVMPYVMAEEYFPLDTSVIGSVRAASAGFNFRPVPTLVLKTGYSYGKFDDRGLLTGSLQAYSITAAWVF